MGQCGCSDTSPDLQFPGPDGVIYALQIYPSCGYCSTPAGVDVYRFDTAGEDTEMWLGGVSALRFMPYSADQPVNAQASVPVLDPRHMVAALNEDRDEDTREIAEQDIRGALPDAVWRTLSEWRALPEVTT